MPRKQVARKEARIQTRYRGRLDQVRIYLGKFLRMFIYQNDWKVLPMTVLVAGLVGLVIRRDFMVSMEGTLKGALALACVSIWNGFFNSVQVICRERNIIKREHRSGMHISSYIMAHMIYQALLCVVQTVLTVHVCVLMGIKLRGPGLFTSWMILDLMITIFLITYAADMLSLWISSLAHNTTTAMTVMPFVLIFQLVFSGGVFSVPRSLDPIASLTISNYGFKCIAAQADANNRPMVSAWNSLRKLEGEEIELTTTVGQMLDYLSDESNPGVYAINSTEVAYGITMGDVVQIAQQTADEQRRATEISISPTVGEVLDAIGRDKVMGVIQTRTAQASSSPDYENSKANIGLYWFSLLLFILVCVLLSVGTLEFIDKDKR